MSLPRVIATDARHDHMVARELDGPAAPAPVRTPSSSESRAGTICLVC